MSAQRKHKLKEHDQLLKTFQYSKALDSVLRKVGLSFSVQRICFTFLSFYTFNKYFRCPAVF